jgi:hemin uptake protein HemP
MILQTRTIRNTIVPNTFPECKPPESNEMMTTESPETPPEPAPKKTESRPHIVESSALFGKDIEVVIRHNGREYRLRRTRLGKLILTA